MAKILVTGASGFVGRSLVPALILAGHQVRCAVRRRLDCLDAEQIIVDNIESQTDWSDALDGMDTVIHLAARVHVMREKSASPAEEYLKTNVLATQVLAAEAAKHKIKRFIFLSSIKVNGELTLNAAPFTEEDVPKPEDPYGQSKLLAEQSLQLIAAETGMEYVILRPPLVYGPGVKANFFKMLQLANKAWPLPFGSINNRRSFIYVDNLVSALSTVIDAPNAANQLFLVADNTALSLPQLLRTIAYAMNKPARLIPVPPGLMRFFFKLIGLNGLNTRLFSSLEINTDKIKSQLAWTAPINSAEGLLKTAKWYLTL